MRVRVQIGTGTRSQPTPRSIFSIPAFKLRALTRQVWAPQTWQVVSGAGAVVGVIDTGANAAHPALAGNLALHDDQTPYWLDATGTCPPGKICDDHGHGTFMLGVAVGQNGFGVAPGAKWMACKAIAVDPASSTAVTTRAAASRSRR